MNDQQFEMEKMRREAEKRMAEMKKRATVPLQTSQTMPPMPPFVSSRYNNQAADSNLRQHNRETISSFGLQENTSNKSNPSFSGIENKKNKGKSILNMLNFKNFNIDNDILIILIMFLLLSSDDSDELLLLALIYIMM